MKKAIKIFCLLTSITLLLSCTSGVALREEILNKLPGSITGRDDDLYGDMLAYSEVFKEAYFVEPRLDTPRGSVLLLHDDKGLSRRFKQLADDIAAEGYNVLAPDMPDDALSSALGGDVFASNPSQSLSALHDLIDEASRFLRSREMSNGRVAIIGWSAGATIALSYSLTVRDADATALFFSRLPDDPELFYRLNHEIYATFSDAQTDVSYDLVSKIQYVQRSQGAYSDIYVYPESDEDFWLYVDSNSQKNTVAAEDAWIRLKVYLYKTIRDHGGKYEKKR